MGPYVLIIILFSSVGNPARVEVRTQDFSNQSRCENAKQQVIEAAQEMTGASVLRAYCEPR